MSLEGARKVITVRSSLTVKNKLDIPIDLLAQNAEDNMTMLLTRLHPLNTYYVPLHVVQWKLFAKPSNFDVDYARDPLEWRDVKQPFEEQGFVRKCLGKATTGLFR